MRPRNIRQERERLYDDALRQKMISNLLKEENVKLKTKVHILEGELAKKERLVDDLLLQQDGAPKPGKLKLDSHLSTNLKRKVRELQASVASKQGEVEALKRQIKSTKLGEIEVEMKLYIDECGRLRQQLEEVIRSKDTFADPQEVRIIEERFQQQDLLIQQLRGEGQQLALTLNQREEELRQARDQQERQKKGGKDAAKVRKALKERERETGRLRQELAAQKAQNEEFRAKIEELIR